MSSRERAVDQAFEAVHAWYKAVNLHASAPLDPELRAQQRAAAELDGRRAIEDYRQAAKAFKEASRGSR